MYLNMLGYFKSEKSSTVYESKSSRITALSNGNLMLSERRSSHVLCKTFHSVEDLASFVIGRQAVSGELDCMFRIIRGSMHVYCCVPVMCSKSKKSSRELSENLVRVRSSNVWAYALDVQMGSRYGDLYVQFKGKNGGPGDVYEYFNFPVRMWKKFVSAPSKGHFFWKYVRNNFRYRKLTGDKRGKLSNAIN